MRTFALAFAAAALAAPAGAAPAPAVVLDPGGHTGRVWKVAFTPDGKNLVSVSFDKSVRVWDVATGEPVRTIWPPAGPGEGGMMIAAAVSPDGKRMAVAGIGPDPKVARHPVYVLDLATGRLVRVLTGPAGVVNFVAYSPDGRFLAAGSHDSAAHVWDADGKPVATLRGHKGMIEALAFAPDGRLLTTAHDMTARVWSLPDGKLLTAWDAHDKPISAAAWNKDGATVATAAQDGAVKFWTPAGKLVRAVPGAASAAVSCVTFTPDSRRAVFSAWSNEESDSRIKGVIDVATGTISQEARSNLSLTDAAVSPDGTLLAVATVQADIVLQSMADGKLVRKLTARGSKSLYNVAWTPDGRGVAWSTDYDPSTASRARLPLVRGFDFATLDWIAKPPADCVRPELTRRGRTLKWNAGQEQLELRKGDDLLHVLTPRQADGQTEAISSFAWWGDDRVAVGGQASVATFDPDTGKQLRRLVGPTDIVMAVAASPDGRFLAATGNDRTVRVYTPDRVNPLVSLFAAGNDWVAWTPEGYYAASPGGERLMAWRVDNGPDQLATVYPAAQFRKSLYRPDVIKLMLKEGTVEAALAAANAARPKAAAAVTVAEVLPPLVIITTPDQPKVEADKPTMDVRVVARPVGSQPITAVRLLMDGRPYSGVEGVKTFNPPRAGEVRESWTVALAPGVHTFAVVAETAASKGTSEPVEVFLGARGMTRGTDDPRKVEDLQKPALYALCVGVSNYADEKLKLTYAAADAEALAKAIEAGSKGVFRKVEVKVLTDGKATRRAILKELTWLRKQMTQNDVAVVSFAGHGEKDPTGVFYLLPADVEQDDLLGTAVKGAEVKELLAGTPGKFVLLLDACHSGGIGGERTRGVGGATDDYVRDLATDDYGVVVLCSSTGKELSIESRSAGHGFFTLALLEGLAGKGPKTADGVVYLHHLDGYVTERVKELSAGRQHPVTAKPASVRSFPLTKP